MNRVCNSPYRTFAEISSLAVLVGLVFAVTTWAQATASLSGRVTDSSGAAIPGAKITVISTETGATRSAVTEESGFYRVLPFILPPAGTFGNAARDSLIGPGLATLDLSLFKNIPISERTSLQFRAEVFNTLNRANFGVPNALTLNPDGTPRATAGLITTTTTTSRQLQFGMRLVW